MKKELLKKYIKLQSLLLIITSLSSKSEVALALDLNDINVETDIKREETNTMENDILTELDYSNPILDIKKINPTLDEKQVALLKELNLELFNLGSFDHYRLIDIVSSLKITKNADNSVSYRYFVDGEEKEVISKDSNNIYDYTSYTYELVDIFSEEIFINETPLIKLIAKEIFREKYSFVEENYFQHPIYQNLNIALGYRKVYSLYSNWLFSEYNYDAFVDEKDRIVTKELIKALDEVLINGFETLDEDQFAELRIKFATIPLFSGTDYYSKDKKDQAYQELCLMFEARDNLEEYSKNAKNKEQYGYDQKSVEDIIYISKLQNGESLNIDLNDVKELVSSNPNIGPADKAIMLKIINDEEAMEYANLDFLFYELIKFEVEREKYEDGFYNGDVCGYFSPIDDKIALVLKNISTPRLYNNVVVHETHHLLSGNPLTDTPSFYDEEKHGVFLNEGITEMLVDKHIGEVTYPSYITNRWIVRTLSELIGKEEMIKSYYTKNGLDKVAEKLAKYADGKEEAKELLQQYDSINEIPSYISAESETNYRILIEKTTDLIEKCYEIEGDRSNKNYEEMLTPLIYITFSNYLPANYDRLNELALKTINKSADQLIVENWGKKEEPYFSEKEEPYKLIK